MPTKCFLDVAPNATLDLENWDIQMSITSFVAAGAAGLAAILSAVNLYLSGRRELDRWLREALVEAIVQFLESSFRIRSLQARFLFPTVRDGKTTRENHAKIIAAHDLETENLTRLRLLAPSNVVEAAEALHEADHLVIDTYFSEIPETDFSNAIASARDSRVNFVRAARSAFRLRGAARITHRHERFRWYEFRDMMVAEGNDDNQESGDPDGTLPK